MKWVNEFHARMDRWGERLSKKELRIPVDLTVGVLFFLFALAILYVLPAAILICNIPAEPDCGCRPVDLKFPRVWCTNNGKTHRQIGY